MFSTQPQTTSGLEWPPRSEVFGIISWASGNRSTIQCFELLLCRVRPVFCYNFGGQSCERHRTFRVYLTTSR